MMNLMYVLNASFTEGRQQEVEHDKENIYQQKQRLWALGSLRLVQALVIE